MTEHDQSGTGNVPQPLVPSWFATFLIVSAIAAVIAGISVIVGFTPVLEDSYYGTDTWLRMMRVGDLLAEFDWFTVTLVDANYPWGLQLHWTRPWDFVLFLIVWPLSQFLSPSSALFLGGTIAPPLILIATSLVTAWAAETAFGKEARLWAALAIFVQPATVSYALAGRPDHHVFQFLIFAGVIGLLLKLVGDHHNIRTASALGVLAVLGVWVSPEFLILLLIAAITLGLLAVAHGRSFEGAFLAFGLAALASIVVALLLERGGPSNWRWEPDRLSWVHFWATAAVSSVALLATALIRLSKAKTSLQRFLLLAGAAMATAIGLLAFIPELFVDPMREATRAGPDWMVATAELTSLLPTGLLMLGRFLMELGIPLIAMSFAGYRLIHLPSGRERQQWILLAGAGTLFFALGLYQFRSAPYAQIIGAIVLPAMIMAFRTSVTARVSAERQGLSLALVTALPFVGFAIMGSMFMNLGAEAMAPNAAQSCNVRNISAVLSRIADDMDQPTVVLTGANFAPELLYRAPVHVLGLPSHRNSDGMLDGYRALHSPDAALAETIITDRSVSHILICPGHPEQSPFSAEERAKGLAANLAAGMGPDWATEIELNDAVGAFRLFAVQPIKK